MGLALQVLFPVELVAVICGCMDVCAKLVRRKINVEGKKHYGIKTLGESKLNSIKNLVSKSLQNGQISDHKFTTILEELKRYNEMKDNLHTAQTGLSESKKKS